MCVVCENHSTPGFEHSDKLDCSNCPTITNIPIINGLKELNCSNCPLLTNIPHINGLKVFHLGLCILNINYCESVEEILKDVLQLKIFQ